MIGKARVVEDDLFGIARRIRAIDEGYFVVENYNPRRYEVHHRGQKGNTLALLLPYAALDERAVRQVLKTRSERREEILREAEEDNRALEKKILENAVKKAEKEVENAYGKL